MKKKVKEDKTYILKFLFCCINKTIFLNFPFFLLCDIIHFYLNYIVIILVLLFNFGSIFNGLRSKVVFSCGSVLVSTENLKFSISRAPTGSTAKSQYVK